MTDPWTDFRTRMTLASLFAGGAWAVWLAAVWTFGGNTITLRTDIFGEHYPEIAMFLVLAGFLFYTASLWARSWLGGTRRPT